MLFNSEAYLIFLPLVVLLFWITPLRWRPALLLVASYVFYMFWKPIYIVLIVAATAVNYGFGLWIARAEAHKKALLFAAITFNLVMLGFFKYAYFLRDLFNIPLNWTGYELQSIPFEIILPLGISFFVFEFIHYVADVYKGSKPITSFVHFALFPSFFPTQIAGPIKRFQDFVPQLTKPAKLSLLEFDQAVELVLVGLFKKVVIADNIGQVVQVAYATPNALTSLSNAWLASYAFLFQVFFDFSGYTDIARGSAQLLGFKVPKNFDFPIFSDSIQTFWQRWHISLSEWLRDYVYLPTSGENPSLLRKHGSLLFTMLVCGLWHGAALHFVMFGLAHGIFLIVHREWRRLVKSSQMLLSITQTKVFHVLAIMLSLQSLVASLALFPSRAGACRF